MTEKHRRAPVEPVTVDAGRLSDIELDQVIVLLMQGVTRAKSVTVQRFFIALTRDLTDVALSRDEAWVGLAPMLEEIAGQM